MASWLGPQAADHRQTSAHLSLSDPQAAEQLGLPRVVSIQNSYSLLVRGPFETDLAETCAPRQCNVGLLAYSPLAGERVGRDMRAWKAGLLCCLASPLTEAAVAEGSGLSPCTASGASHTAGCVARARRRRAHGEVH